MEITSLSLQNVIGLLNRSTSITTLFSKQNTHHIYVTIYHEHVFKKRPSENLILTSKTQKVKDMFQKFNFQTSKRLFRIPLSLLEKMFPVYKAYSHLLLAKKYGCMLIPCSCEKAPNKVYI
jgi:hypothetical protein